MAKESGMGDRFYVSGYDLSGDIGSLSRIGGGPATLDVTDITQSAHERLGGRRDGAIEFTAWFDPAAGASHPRLAALPTSDVITTYQHGSAIGNPAASCIGLQIDYAGTRAADGAFSFAVNVQSDGYGLEWGDQLTAGKRTDTTATNGSSLDGTASTAFGLQAYCQMTAFSGTNITVKLQDSADNSTFADLTAGAFTAFTAVGAQRIATANNATVRRYLRVATTGTFTSATFLVMAVRNQTLMVF